MVRTCFGTNNVDNCARVCNSASVAGLAMTLGCGGIGLGTTRMVADELAAKEINIEHSRITIEPPIKSLGSFEADVKLHADVTAKVKIWVVRG